MTERKSSFSFPGKYRLKTKKDFALDEASARKLYSKHFLLLVAERDDRGESRIGITITKKVAKSAVVRNKLRRRIREIFRRYREKLTRRIDLVIVARRDSPLCDFAQVQKEILGALRYHGYLEKEPVA